MMKLLRRWWSSSIRHKITAAFLAIFFITYSPAASIIFTTIETSMRDAQVRTLDQIAVQKRQRLSAMFVEAERNLRAWAGLEVMNDIFALDVDKRIAGTLTRLKKQYELPGDLFVFDEQGRLVAATLATLPDIRLPTKWKITAGDYAFIDKHQDPLARAPGARGASEKGGVHAGPREIVALVRRIHGNFGNRPPIGLMVATVPWSAVRDGLGDRDTPVLLIDKDHGRALSLPGFLLSEDERLTPVVSSERELQLGGARFLAGYADGGKGVPGYWRVVALQDVARADAPIRRVAWQLTVLGLVLLAPISAGIHWLARRLTGPLQALEETVGAMRARQDLSLRAEIVSDDEIGSLARAFNDLADSLQAISREREEALRRLEQLNATLEKRVRARTAELEEANEELKHALEQLKAAQSQLVHSEKMASLGQLVAGVAHELNNPIGFIYANFQHLQEYTEDVFATLDEITRLELPDSVMAALRGIFDRHDIDFIREDLPKIIKSGRSGATRIKEIVSALRRFSRLDEADVKRVRIEDGLDETLAILHNHIKNRIEVVKDYRLRVPVECRSSQVNQVFMNIIHNAIQAMGEKGRLKITTEREGDMAVVRISDDGPGIAPEIRDRIFDPFFTTKKVGEGTGLGLSISYGIIEDHGGSIAVESAPGDGATFIICLPLRYAGRSNGGQEG